MKTVKPLLLVAAAGLGLAACQPVPYNPNDPNANARRGAAIGAATGAIAGAVTADDSGDRLKRALIGGAVGGAGGAAYGNYLDRQAAELQAAYAGSPVSVVNTGNNLVVNLPESILFATDSSAVSGAAASSLQTLAGSLNQYPNSTVQVIGHTDNTGEAAYNQSLSERRASAVSGILVQSGVSPARVSAVGRGEDQPKASNLDEAGRAQNRRVEIIITPTQTS